MTNEISLYFSIALIVLGVVVWVLREVQRGYSPPTNHVPSRVYRLLENARDRRFMGSRQVRFTVFTPDADKGALVPFARLGWGRPSAKSGIVFKSGEGLAGMAAEWQGGLLIARLGPFENLERAREVHHEFFKLSSEQASALSEMQLKTQVLIASSLRKGSLFKGVLCIDSLDPALVPMDDDCPEFWKAIDGLAAGLADALPEPVRPAVKTSEVEMTPGLVVSRLRFESVLLHSSQGSLEFSLPEHSAVA